MINREALGGLLRSARIDRKMSQAAMAERLGLTRKTVISYEAGLTRRMSLESFLDWVESTQPEGGWEYFREALDPTVWAALKGGRRCRKGPG